MLKIIPGSRRFLNVSSSGAGPLATVTQHFMTLCSGPQNLLGLQHGRAGKRHAADALIHSDAVLRSRPPPARVRVHRETQASPT